MELYLTEWFITTKHSEPFSLGHIFEFAEWYHRLFSWWLWFNSKWHINYVALGIFLSHTCGQKGSQALTWLLELIRLWLHHAQTQWVELLLWPSSYQIMKSPMFFFFKKFPWCWKCWYIHFRIVPFRLTPIHSAIWSRQFFLGWRCQ